MHLKKIIATFLVFTLLLSCYACSKPSGQRASIESKGRYMEDKISLFDFINANCDRLLCKVAYAD